MDKTKTIGRSENKISFSWNRVQKRNNVEERRILIGLKRVRHRRFAEASRDLAFPIVVC